MLVLLVAMVLESSDFRKAALALTHMHKHITQPSHMKHSHFLSFSFSVFSFKIHSPNTTTTTTTKYSKQPRRNDFKLNGTNTINMYVTRRAIIFVCVLFGWIICSPRFFLLALCVAIATGFWHSLFHFRFTCDDFSSVP